MYQSINHYLCVVKEHRISIVSFTHYISQIFFSEKITFMLKNEEVLLLLFLHFV